MADNDSDFDMDFTTHRYPNRWDENTWEQEMEQHPIFMTKQPADGKLPPMVEALQQVKYDHSEMTVSEIVNLHKEDGNRAFKTGDYRQAVLCYTEAIAQKTIQNDLNSILYANRAAAHYHLNNNRTALADALVAIDYNSDNVKAMQRVVDCFKRLQNYRDLIDFCDQYITLKSDQLDWNRIRSETEIEMKKQRRDQRRQRLADQKAEEARRAQQSAVVEALRKRNLDFEESALKADHQNADICIKFDSRNNQLLFPVLFLYPEHKTTDLIMEFNESSRLIDHFVEMFDRESPDWDTAGKYKSNTLRAIHRCESSGKICEIDTRVPLLQQLKRHQICLKAPMIGFCVGPNLKLLRKSCIDNNF